MKKKSFLAYPYIIWSAIFFCPYACAGCERSAGNVAAFHTPVEERPQSFHDCDDCVMTPLLRFAGLAFGLYNLGHILIYGRESFVYLRFINYELLESIHHFTRKLFKFQGEILACRFLFILFVSFKQSRQYAVMARQFGAVLCCRKIFVEGIEETPAYRCRLKQFRMIVAHYRILKEFL